MQNDKNVYGQEDHLSELNGQGLLNEKQALLHRSIQKNLILSSGWRWRFFKKSNMLKTFLASMNRKNSLVQYQAMFDDAPGLQDILEMQRSRVVNDLSMFDAGTHTHTQRIREEGFASSYTFPFFNRGDFTGFIFFNAGRTHCFAPEVLDRLDVYAHLIAEIVIAEINLVATMAAALKTAHQMVHYRDPETGNHLERSRALPA